MAESNTTREVRCQDVSHEILRIELKLLALSFLFQNQSAAFTPDEDVCHGLGFILEDMSKKAGEIKNEFEAIFKTV